uniref:uncharacterized protein LOC132681576 isoform X1 n=1 Tax=Panthera onca TaxID=9690 RepID=UPI00295344F7|nr:uncharacterized protein LOC132681576 isoform X1 [Panthera onca]
MKVTVAVARAGAAAVGARDAQNGGGRRGAWELEPLPAPDEMAARPGLVCTASSPEAGQQGDKKMDSPLQPAMCQGLQPIGGKQHQGRVPKRGEACLEKAARVFRKQPGPGHTGAHPGLGACRPGGAGAGRGHSEAPASSEAGRFAVSPGKVSSLGKANFMIYAEKLFSEVLYEGPWLLVNQKMFNSETVSQNSIFHTSSFSSSWLPSPL